MGVGFPVHRWFLTAVLFSRWEKHCTLRVEGKHCTLRVEKVLSQHSNSFLSISNSSSSSSFVFLLFGDSLFFPLNIVMSLFLFIFSWLTDGQPEVDNSPALPESLPDSVSLQWPRLLREAGKRLAGLTLSLYPLLRGLPLKNILCNNFCCCWHLPVFSIGYTALNILHIQGLLYTTAYVFKFYSGKCQVQDCSYLVTYIVCRKNIVFDEKKKKIFFNSLRLHPTDN